MPESNGRKISKETKNKIFWETVIDSVDREGNPCRSEFRLYIHKWRVPEPYPKTIYVKIGPSALMEKPPFVSVDEVIDKPALRKKPITAIIHAFKPHTATLRYHPIGDQDEWEIGEPYIPYAFTHNQSEYLKITIEWKKPEDTGYITFTNS
jgi:hypothetical protein